jgi:hypothetical protein
MTTGCTRRALRAGATGSFLEVDAADAAKGRAAPAAWNSPRRVTPQQRAQDEQFIKVLRCDYMARADAKIASKVRDTEAMAAEEY